MQKYKLTTVLLIIGETDRLVRTQNDKTLKVVDMKNELNNVLLIIGETDTYTKHKNTEDS